MRNTFLFIFLAVYGYRNVIISCGGSGAYLAVNSLQLLLEMGVHALGADVLLIQGPGH